MQPGISTRKSHPTAPRNKGMSAADMRFLSELVDIHKGRPGVVVGNGWSVTYYDTSKMKEDCVLVGCNLGFKIHPLDYLVWQDARIKDECSKAPCIKVVPQRFERQSVSLPPNSTYFYRFGKVGQNAIHRCSLRLMHSGGLALQLAAKLGCNPIYMVGCDCAVIDAVTEQKYRGKRSNVFEDKQVMKAPIRGEFLVVNGKKTTRHLQNFMKKFEMAYNKLKEYTDIYMLGPWSISTTIPWIEKEEWYSDKHPKRHERKC